MSDFDKNTTGPQSYDLSVLRTGPDYRATKKWTWDTKRQAWHLNPFDAGKLFTVEKHRYSNLPEYVEHLEYVRQDERRFVISGALTPTYAALLTANPDAAIVKNKNSKSPTFQEVPLRVLCIDIDTWIMPSWADLATDPESVIEVALRDLLPPSFHDATYWWQLSSSAGFATGVLKVHLFFWMTTSATNQHIKDVLKQSAPGVCRSIYHAVQPIYVHDPVIEGGADPLPRRTGWHKGAAAEVVLPALVVGGGAKRHQGASRRPSGGSIADALARIGDGRDGFHEPLRDAIKAYAARCNHTGERDDEAAKEEFRRALRAAPGYDSIVEATHCKNRYLQQSIDGAFRWLSDNADGRPMEAESRLPTQTLAEGRAAVKTHIQAHYERMAVWNMRDAEDRLANPPEHAALSVAVGVGKSFESRDEMAWLLDVIAEEKNNRVILLAPTHKLKAETLQAMIKQGINAAEFRGREAIDPNGDGKATMCMDLRAVEDAMAINASVENAVCGTAKGAQCPFRTTCAYQRQKAPCAAAAVLIASHRSLFHPLPEEVTKNVAGVIVDESFWQNGLQTDLLDLSSFASDPARYPVLDTELSKDGVSVVSDVDTAMLVDLSRKAET